MNKNDAYLAASLIGIGAALSGIGFAAFVAIRAVVQLFAGV